MQQLEFWNKFKVYVQKHNTQVRLQTPRPQHWFDMRMGSSEAHVCLTINTKDNSLGCEVYIGRNKDLYNFFLQQKDKIESDIGEAAEWINANVASRIKIQKNVSGIFDASKSEEYFDWLLSKTLLFQQTFMKYIREYRD